METAEAETLKRLRQQLVRDMMPDIITDYLYQSGILFEEDVETVKSKATPQARNREILDLLPKRGPLAYNAFRESLSTDFGWLVELLDSTHRALRQSAMDDVDKAAAVPVAIHSDAGQLSHDALTFLTNGLLSSGNLNDWRFFARRIGITDATIRSLEYKYPRDIRQQIYEAVVQWKMTEGSSHATIERVCRALRDEGRIATADELQRRFGR